MSDEHSIVRADESVAGPSMSVSLAKTRLLDWAAENDARARKARRGLGTIAAGSAIATAVVVVGSMAAARVFLGPRRKSVPAQTVGAARKMISGAMLARAGMWLIPIAARAVQRGLDHRGRAEEVKRRGV